MATATTPHRVAANHSYVAMVRRESQGVNRPRATNPDWETVNDLRREMAQYLVRTEGNKKIGYFALRTEGVVKFYRVKKMISGKWAGKTFVDAQASDAWYPVRNPQTLRGVLHGICLDSAGAGKLYADELGLCCRCGRTLTDELSRARGIGPVCWEL